MSDELQAKCERYKQGLMRVIAVCGRDDPAGKIADEFLNPPPPDPVQAAAEAAATIVDVRNGYHVRLFGVEVSWHGVRQSAVKSRTQWVARIADFARKALADANARRKLQP